VAEDKRRLRAEMAARRLALPTEQALRAAAAATRHLASAPEFARCGRVVVYAELAGELPMAPLVEAALRAGKRVLWPRQVGAGGLEFAPAARVEDLVPGRHGVREPPATAPAQPLGPADLLLLPGLAFDLRGGRLGRGGGAWDRVLRDARAGLAVGVGYEFQIVDRVPRELHDRAVAALLTERGFRRCGEA
jgi:5-formyltetrahydrofolate cyclo-ligase